MNISSVCAHSELSAQQATNFLTFKMAEQLIQNSSIVAEAVLEDKLADFWADYPCLYDVCAENSRIGIKPCRSSLKNLEQHASEF